MGEHLFHLEAQWNGGLGGDGKIAVGNLQSAISVPKEMNGPGKGTNPEEMLVGAAATCYLITLAAILERKKVPVQKLELETDGVVALDKGLRFTRITHHPRVQLVAGATEEQKAAAREATERAEKACMISNAIRGNVEVAVDAVLS